VLFLHLPRNAILAPVFAAAVALMATAALAPISFAQETKFTVSIKDHKFEPAQIEVPAGVKFSLLVKNLDPTPEEFESYELNREKIVPGNGEITVFLGPLSAGVYPFFGEFNPETAQGQIIAK
jgi:plastocyanin